MLEYIIIGLLGIVIILIVILLVRGNTGIIDRLSKNEANNMREMMNFSGVISKNMQESFDKLEEKLDRRLILINNKVTERLDENFVRTNKTFENVLERLSRIDEAQKKIDNLSGDIISLQSILTDKKSRGIFGEVNLKHILVNVFGENNQKIYRLQHTLPNTTIVDAMIFAPEPLGNIGIDSKFPLEHYQIMVDKNKSALERQMAEKQFKIDVKKHIDAISSKYIIPGVTANQAIMFLPAEAIFAEINAYHNEIVDYAYKKNVWITSPTTLISTMTTIQVILKNIERDQYAKIVHEELTKLGVEFGRYRERWEKLSRSIDAVSKDAENLNITTEKITRKFEAINDVKIEENKYLE